VRSFLIFVTLVGLGVLYFWQKHNGTPPPAPVAAKTTAASASQPTPPPREVSEHNWMKRSLDRASDVAQKVRAQTKESQDP